MSHISTVSIVLDLPIGIEGLVEIDPESCWYVFDAPIMEGEWYGDGAWLSSLCLSGDSDVKMSVTVKADDMLTAIQHMWEMGISTQSMEVHICS